MNTDGKTWTDRAETGATAPKGGLGYVDAVEDRNGAVGGVSCGRDADAESLDRVRDRLFPMGDVRNDTGGRTRAKAWDVGVEAAAQAEGWELRGHANTEAEAVASFEHLNCPACGGSGHVEDAEILLARRRSAITALEARVRVVEGERDSAISDRMACESRERYWRSKCEVAESERESFRADCFVLDDNLTQVTMQRDQAEKDRDEFAEYIGSLESSNATFRAQLEAMTRDRDAMEVRANGLRDTIMDTAGTIARLTEERDAAATNARNYRDALLAIDKNRPRCRVVTSPRFYGEEDRGRAIARARTVYFIGADGRSALGLLGTDAVGRIVDAVAQALGLRRSEA